MPAEPSMKQGLVCGVYLAPARCNRLLDCNHQTLDQPSSSLMLLVPVTCAVTIALSCW